MSLESAPPPSAFAEPSGTVESAQQVPEQLTRLPTTVAHWSSAGAFGTSPVAVMPTFVPTVPACDASRAAAVFDVAGPARPRVVLASRVAATGAGKSRLAFGGPLSFVILKNIFAPVVHGSGDCGTFR